jgi:hypothetical protein
LVQLRLLFGVLGLCALGFIVWRTGASAIVQALAPALVYLPALAALELLRAVAESCATYLELGTKGRAVPRPTLLRAHIIGASLSALAPAPRVVNESIKATFFVPYVGGPAATSVGFINQAATLSGVGLFSVPCALAVFITSGASVWFWAIAVHAVVLVASGLALRGATRASGVGRVLVHWFPRFAERTSAFQQHAAQGSMWSAGPTLALVVGRLLQMIQYGIAARAVGIDAGMLQALAAEGVALVAGTVGVLVPGGVGTTDGAFTMAAGMLGTTAVRATSLSLLMRCMQVVWLLVGSLLALLPARTNAA